MHYLIIARDGSDADAPGRRQAAREAHLAGARAMKAAGTLLVGAALLDGETADGKMVGSVVLVDFPSRAELDAWLARDPYVLGKVWDRIDVVPCRVSV